MRLSGWSWSVKIITETNISLPTPLSMIWKILEKYSVACVDCASCQVEEVVSGWKRKKQETQVLLTEKPLLSFFFQWKILHDNPTLIQKYQIQLLE